MAPEEASAQAMSPAQRRVLVALCAPLGRAPYAPPGDQQRDRERALAERRRPSSHISAGSPSCSASPICRRTRSARSSHGKRCHPGLRRRGNWRAMKRPPSADDETLIAGPQASADVAHLPGDVIAGYEVEDVAGRGGRGIAPGARRWTRPAGGAEVVRPGARGRSRVPRTLHRGVRASRLHIEHPQRRPDLRAPARTAGVCSSDALRRGHGLGSRLAESGLLYPAATSEVVSQVAGALDAGTPARPGASRCQASQRAVDRSDTRTDHFGIRRVATRWPPTKDSAPLRMPLPSSCAARPSAPQPTSTRSGVCSTTA